MFVTDDEFLYERATEIGIRRPYTSIPSFENA
jgi:hypothetical protein